MALKPRYKNLTNKQKKCLEFWDKQLYSAAGWGHDDEYIRYLFLGSLNLCCPEIMTAKEKVEYNDLCKLEDKDYDKKYDEKFVDEFFRLEKE
jgi:hypothetical protein